jgi:hypothetical protein
MNEPVHSGHSDLPQYGDPRGMQRDDRSDVMSSGVENELSCVMGWQDVVAHSALASEVGRTAYVKTLCRRAAADPSKPGAPR